MGWGFNTGQVWVEIIKCAHGIASFTWTHHMDECFGGLEIREGVLCCYVKWSIGDRWGEVCYGLGD